MSFMTLVILNQSTSHFFKDTASTVALREMFSVELKFMVDTLKVWVNKIIKPKFFELDYDKKLQKRKSSDRWNCLQYMWFSTWSLFWKWVVWSRSHFWASFFKKYLFSSWNEDLSAKNIFLEKGRNVYMKKWSLFYSNLISFCMTNKVKGIPISKKFIWILHLY